MASASLWPRKKSDPEDVFHILRHLAANDRAIRITGDEAIGSQKYSYAK